MAEQSAQASAGRGAGRKWLNAVGLIVCLVCMGFFVDHFMSLSAGVPDLSGPVLMGLSLAVIVYCAACLISALGWTMLLAGLGVAIARRLGAGIFLVSQFGKYLPGNVGQHIGRVGLATRSALPLGPVVTSILIETAIVLGAVLLLGMPILLSYFDTLTLLATGLLLAGSVAAVALMAGKTGLAPLRRLHLAGADRAQLLGGGLVLILALPLTSSSLVLLHPAFLQMPDVALKVGSLFCAAWLAGFLTPGAPAGLGVRELILANGLSPLVGPEAAAMTALLLRLVTTAGDAIVFAIGLLLLKRARRVLHPVVAT